MATSAKSGATAYRSLEKPDCLILLPYAVIEGQVPLPNVDSERQLELTNSCYVLGYRSEGSLSVGLVFVSSDGTSGKLLLTNSSAEQR
jgi:hypothetical protein